MTRRKPNRQTAMPFEETGFCLLVQESEHPLIGGNDAGSAEPFCACGRRWSQCDRSRRGCGKLPVDPRQTEIETPRKDRP